MLDKLIEILRASGADAWEVTDTHRIGWEFYFIRHKLDQNRFTDTEAYTVKVYRKISEGKFLGSAQADISTTASEEEIRRIVDGLCQDARYVLNPAYTLNKPVSQPPVPETPVDVKAISRDFLQALSSLPETATEDLNSYEIFVSEIRRRFINSEGVDVVSVYPRSMAEVVRRRFTHDDAPGAKPLGLQKPDLFICDGGITQLRATRAALEELGIGDVPTIGLAERQEELVFDDGRENLLLPRDSEALFVCTRLRDEAHRFAITYHRHLRDKDLRDRLKKA